MNPCVSIPYRFNESETEEKHYAAKDVSIPYRFNERFKSIGSWEWIFSFNSL